MDQHRRFKELGLGAVGAIIVLLIVAAAVPNQDPTYEYHVAYDAETDSLEDIQGTTGSTSSIPLSFEKGPYTVDFELTWTPNQASAETMTLTLLDPDGTAVASESSSTGTLEFSAEIATAPATTGPYEATSEAEAESEAESKQPDDVPATTGWTAQIERTFAFDDSAAGGSTSWTLATSYDALAGSAMDIDRTAAGTDKGLGVAITAIVEGSLLIIWAAVLLVMRYRFQKANVAGWDRASKEQKYSRTEAKPTKKGGKN